MEEGLHTFLLAQALGLFLVIMAIIMGARAQYYKKLFSHLKEGSSTILLAGTVGLIFGIVMVLIHNLWLLETEVIITLVAWFVLIKSILWLSFPNEMVNVAKKVYSGWGYYLVAIVSGALGIILMAHGFYPYTPV